MIATRAERTTDGFRISGQKIWTFGATGADFGALLARTSGARGDPDGVSYFIVPMGSAGLTIVPIKDLGGASAVSEVFFDDVDLPADHLIGELGAGLRIRRPIDPVPTVPFNPGFGAGHDPAVFRLLDLAGRQDVPAALRRHHPRSLRREPEHRCPGHPRCRRGAQHRYRLGPAGRRPTMAHAGVPVLKTLLIYFLVFLLLKTRTNFKSIARYNFNSFTILLLLILVDIYTIS